MVSAPNMPLKKGINSMNRITPNPNIIAISEYFQNCSFMLVRNDY